VKLTGREKEVLEYVAWGLSNKEIANKLHLSEQTIKNHIHNLMLKLETHNRIKLASFYWTKDDSLAMRIFRKVIHKL
jgi:DNA-binding NarL/FixJ family response regulator